MRARLYAVVLVMISSAGRQKERRPGEGRLVRGSRTDWGDLVLAEAGWIGESQLPKREEGKEREGGFQLFSVSLMAV